MDRTVVDRKVGRERGGHAEKDHRSDSNPGRTKPGYMGRTLLQASYQGAPTYTDLLVGLYHSHSKCVCVCVLT